MKDRGIIFTGESIRAIVDRRKTQTRRLVALKNVEHEVASIDRLRGQWAALDPKSENGPWVRQGGTAVRCPYAIGATIWVKETWGVRHEHAKDIGEQEALADAKSQLPWAGILYKADDIWTHAKPGRWRSPLFMPRWASRIALKVTDVRVQRVHDISEEEAIAEGCEATRGHGHPAGNDSLSAREQYAATWDQINGRKAPWSTNPWVWAISFEVPR